MKSLPLFIFNILIATFSTGLFNEILAAPQTEEDIETLHRKETEEAETKEILELTANKKPDCIKLSEEEPCPINSAILGFWLYTRDTLNNPYLMNYTNIQGAPINPKVPTIVSIHGYTGSRNYAPNPELRAAYFSIGEYNFISIDWGRLAEDGCYIDAVKNVHPVGVCSAQFIDLLVSETKIKPEDIHVIGFSLGAHVAGNLGRTLSFKLRRLSALDPAFPLFGPLSHNNYSLKKTDAKFLDVTHTNGGMKGKIEPLGDVDFYMNNAMVQPGCPISNSSCSHYRAVLYYAESITTKVGFWGYRCKGFFDYILNKCEPSPVYDWVLMGEYVNFSVRGDYFVQTNSAPPFARGKVQTPQT